MEKTEAIKVLAIDDKPDNLTTLRAVVRDAIPQTRVLTATNGPAGIELAAAEDPDVILLDIVMPGMDGFEVCRRLKADDRIKDIPVVFLTALKTDTASRIKAMETGGEGFLAKPLETVELTAQIQAMAKVKRANRSQRTEKDRLKALVAERTRALQLELIERKQAEIEREKLQAQLNQAQKMESIGTLAGGIAHDFNNILFPIIGHSEILMDDVPKDSPLQESLKEIYTGALRAKDLVQQILAFARQEKNELRMMRMQPIIKEALKLIRSTIPTSIAISQNIQPVCGAVKADPTQIHQIVMNLATNAWHAMAENGGKLSVSLKQIELDEYNQVTPDMSPGLYACLTVADTGTGMDQELIHRIFDPFFTTKEKDKGTGMGLSVIHGIVKSMNGVIQVYSKLEKGSEFHIYLPVVETVSQTQKIKACKPIPGGMEKILLVDDESAIIALEKASLSRLGYQVTTCISSTEALEIFLSGPDQFDMVITDMAMPNLSGDRLAGELIKIRPDIPILLCTGFSDRLTDEKIKSLGIRGILFKPLVIKDFAEKIREVLDNTPTGTNE